VSDREDEGRSEAHRQNHQDDIEKLRFPESATNANDALRTLRWMFNGGEGSETHSRDPVLQSAGPSLRLIDQHHGIEVARELFNSRTFHGTPPKVFEMIDCTTLTDRMRGSESTSMDQHIGFRIPGGQPETGGLIASFHPFQLSAKA
jgi:hypothetical protein